MAQLTPNQLEKLTEIKNPLARQRFALLFQLPQDLRNSMLNEATADSIWKITKDKYSLPDSKISAVAKIIGLIFLGELPIKNFIAALKNDLGVDVPTAQNIAQDINTAIFQPVRESLMTVHGLERGSTPINTRNNADNRGISNSKAQMPNQFQSPNDKLRQQPSNNSQVQQRREEVLRKIRPAANNNTQARPISYTHPRRNVVNLRNTRRRGKYDGFFT